MPVVDFSFMQFVILVLPGFWALWIYKPFILKGNVTEHWENDLTLALMFGFVGYIAAGISSKYFGWTSGIIMLFVSDSGNTVEEAIDVPEASISVHVFPKSTE